VGNPIDPDRHAQKENAVSCMDRIRNVAAEKRGQTGRRARAIIPVSVNTHFFLFGSWRNDCAAPIFESAATTAR
jgi:hypothetical protein